MTTCYIAAQETIKELQALMAALRGEELKKVQKQLEELVESYRF